MEIRVTSVQSWVFSDSVSLYRLGRVAVGFEVGKEGWPERFYRKGKGGDAIDACDVDAEQVAFKIK